MFMRDWFFASGVIVSERRGTANKVTELYGWVFMEAAA